MRRHILHGSFPSLKCLSPWSGRCLVHLKLVHICPSISMPRVATLLVCDGIIANDHCLTCVEVVVKTAAFFLLALWLFDMSSTLGFRYWKIGGVLSVRYTTL